MKTVAYHYSPSKVRLFFPMREWAVRNLKAKGAFSMVCFLVRPLTQIEEEELDPNRAEYVDYFSWDLLILDDIDVGVPEEYIEKIRNFSKNKKIG